MYITLGLVNLLFFTQPSVLQAKEVTSAQGDSKSVLVRVIPAQLDHHTVYPTGHAVLALGPWDAARWEELRLPESWVNQGYYFELWDIENSIIPGFASKKLEQSTIDLRSIDATIYPALRLVLFEPANSLDPVVNVPVYFQYSQKFNIRLAVFAALIILATVLWLFVAWWQKISFLDIWKISIAVLRGQETPSHTRQIILLVAVIVGWSGVFGAALGSFIGVIQIIYLLIKLPVLLLGAFLFSVLSIWVLSALMGAATSLRRVMVQALGVLASISLSLAALSPLVYFDIILPQHHDWLLISAVFYFGMAGVMGALRLFLWLSQAGRFKALFLVTLWVFLYGGVLTQLGWMLRPWVGETDPIQNTVPFSRLYSGNVYVELTHAILRL